MKDKFLLDKDVVFLNHGSFGAIPRQVMAAWHRWQERVEEDPVLFNAWQWVDDLEKVRHRLAAFVGTKPGNIAFIENSTFGVNTVAHSFDLGEGDQVVLTNWEYGACVKTWRYYARKKGFEIKTVTLPLHFSTREDLIRPIVEAITERTRVIFISHIFSPTGVIFPVEKITAIAHEKGIWTVVDGAHAPGQINLNLDQLGVDFYFGNCHKWMFSARGAGFLYVRPEYQHLIHPPIVSWGKDWERPHPVGFIALVEMQGTRDYTTFLTVGDALDFIEEHSLLKNQVTYKQLMKQVSQELIDIFGLNPLSYNLDFFSQMYAYPLPQHTDREDLYKFLYLKNKIQVPITQIGEQLFLRISFQAYNTQSDYEKLLEALRRYF